MDENTLAFLKAKEQEAIKWLEEGAIEAAMEQPPDPLQPLESRKKRLVAKMHQAVDESQQLLVNGWKAIVDVSREENWDKLDEFIEWFQFKDLNITDIAQDADLEKKQLSDLVHIPYDYLRQMHHVGVVLYQKQSYDEALAVITVCLLFNPNTYQIWFLLGLIQHEKQNYPKALLAYQRAIVCDEKNPYPYLNMVKAWIAINERSEAKESLAAAKELCTAEYATLIPEYEALKRQLM